MALTLQDVDIGTVANDGTGDPARTAFDKINTNNSTIETSVLLADGTNNLTGDLVFTEKADHTSTPSAGEGYLWVKNTAPSTLVYTDDAGTDFTLGSGNLSNVVEDLSPQLGGMLDVNNFALGDGTLELLKFTETGSAVNEFTIANAATGNAPVLSATGDDANIGITLTPKGTGNVTLGTLVFNADQAVGAGTDNYVLTFDNGTGLISLEAAAASGWADMTESVWTGGAQSEIADGASAIAFEFDTDAAYSTAGAKLASWKNNTTEKAYIDKDGTFVPDADQAGVGSIQGFNGGIRINSGIGGESWYIGSSAGGGASAHSLYTGGIEFHRNQSSSITIGSKAHSNDNNPTNAISLLGQTAFTTAVTNLDGGALNLTAGAGASASAGDADGGAVTITGGGGYGTGDGGNIVLAGGAAAGSGIQGIVDISAGTEVHLDQTTADAPFFNFQATADADATSAISTLTTSGATTHHIQIEINGTTAWIACSTTDPS